MKRLIITNNPKVQEILPEKAQVDYKQVSALKIIEEADALVKKGAKLLIDPLRTPLKSYYRSMPFLIDDTDPSQANIDAVGETMNKMRRDPEAYSKEPVMSSLQQKKDLNLIMKIFG